MTNANYGKLTSRLIAGWFVLALGAAALHAFRTEPNHPPLIFGMAALAPIAIFLVWFATSQPFRQFAMALNPRILTFVHAWRIAGFVFLVLYTYHILPGTLALPAGWGDIAIGATASLVAAKLASPNHAKAFLFWHALGITDLVTALTLGATAGLIDPHGIATSVMTELPMSLIPTFAVPLLLILHLICIFQARHWKEQRYTISREQLSSSPA